MNGISRKDIRVFFDNKSGDWIVANDYKRRRLINQGYSNRKAKDKSHGHLNKKEDAEIVKENILANKRTKSRDIWILGCYVRVCDKTYSHYKWVCGLYKSKNSKGRQNYFKVNNGVFR